MLRRSGSAFCFNSKLAKKKKKKKIGSKDTCHLWKKSFRTRRAKQHTCDKSVHLIFFVQDRATYKRNILFMQLVTAIQESDGNVGCHCTRYGFW